MAPRGLAHDSLQQFCVGHDELLPVDKDQGHFSFREKVGLRHPFLENLKFKAEKKTLHVNTQVCVFSASYRVFHMLQLRRL